ncbi:MAG: contractile injection system tape measure protein, partial [Draconibacterium sp.]|nr:contractile injection system tape measure protein [Draconibacterium sp.]
DSKKNQVIREIKGIIQILIPENVLNQSGFAKNKNRIVEKPFEKEDLKKEATGNEKDDTVLIAQVKDDAENIASDKIDEDQIVSDEIKARQPKKKKSVAGNDKTDRTETDGFDKKTESKGGQSKQVESKENSAFFDKDKNEIWVQNAGLILLHPFLKPFFITTEMCDKQGRFLSEDYDLPIQSLHYLATGDENFFEGSLIFEKFLCGVPLKIPVRQTSVLTGLIKTEATVLLNEVVKNWPALKNTSADGLRQMFIQRDGKLIQKEDSYKLIVERKAQDVLLEKLNWNTSMIKLPWISKIVFTEW